MKRNIKFIIASLLVLVILGGGYFFLLKWNPDKAEEDSSSSPIEGNIEYAIEANSEDVSFVRINNGEITYTVRNGEKPVIEGYSSHILEDSQLSSIIYDATAVSISRKISIDGKNIADFGIGDGGKSITVSMKDGSSKTLLIGNSTNIDGEYYAMLSGADTVYTVSAFSLDRLMKHPSEMRSKSICTLDGQNIAAFTVKKNGNRVISIKYDENYTPENEYQPVSFLITYPYNNIKASLDRLQEFFESISSLNADSIVEENPKKLSSYGLDKPYEVEFTDYEGKKTTVRLGNYAEDGKAYVMCNDIPVVYLAECSFYETVKAIEPAKYADNFINLFNIDTVREISVRAEGEEYLLSIGKEDGKEAVYKLGDKILVEKNFKILYQSIIGITAADFVSENAAGKEKCSISFSFTDGSKKNFTYYIYNDRYCIVKADNNLTCLTLTKNIDSMLQQLKEKQ